MMRAALFCSLKIGKYMSDKRNPKPQYRKSNMDKQKNNIEFSVFVEEDISNFPNNPNPLSYLISDVFYM